MSQLPRKITVALCRLSSWFDSVGIVNSLSRTAGFHLTILDGAGEPVEVAVLESWQKPPADGLYVRAADVNTNDRNVSFFAFKILSAQAGHEPKAPVDRGGSLPINPETGKPRKLHYRDNFELVAMRHSQFRTSPNPNRQRFDRYRPVMQRCCQRFYRMNEGECRQNFLTVDDLMTYAMVWTTNYMGNWELPASHRVEENDKLLTDYLKQCFAEFIDIMRKKARNILPTVAAACEFHGQDPSAPPSLKVEKNSQSKLGWTREVEFVAPPKYAEVVDDDPEYRQAHASHQIRAKLAKLPPDQARAALKTVSENQALEPSVRRMARTMLEDFPGQDM